MLPRRALFEQGLLPRLIALPVIRRAAAGSLASARRFGLATVADWQALSWRKYDPRRLFFARHRVACEAWSEDGFIRV